MDVMETMSTTAYYISARHFAAAYLRLVPGRHGTRAELQSGCALPTSQCQLTKQQDIFLRSTLPLMPTHTARTNPRMVWTGQVTRRQTSVLAILEPNAWSPHGTDVLLS